MILMKRFLLKHIMQSNDIFEEKNHKVMLKHIMPGMDIYENEDL